MSPLGPAVVTPGVDSVDSMRSIEEFDPLLVT